MKGLKSIAFFGVLVAWLAAGCAGETEAGVTKVTVLDSGSNVIRELKSAEDLAEFERIWSGREELSEQPDLLWSNKIDIERNGRSDRWLYQPNGIVQILSAKKSPAYRIRHAAKLRQLLGI